MDDITFVIDSLTYQAFSEGEFNGATTWMVRRYLTPGVDTSSNANYVETLFSLPTKDARTAVDHAIATNIWA